MNKAGQICGAKTRRGTPCTNAPMPNGRCRMHGGKTPKGVPKSHGLYTDGLFEDEKELWDSIAVDDLTDEIKIVKVQLARALKGLKASQVAQAADADDWTTGFENVERTAEDSEEKGPRLKQVRKQPDWRAHIDRLTGRLAHLMQVQFQIRGSGENASEAAAKIKAAIAEIEQAIEAPNAEQPT
jgi:hypothetical protein